MKQQVNEKQMKIMDGKSILLGMGIGIIITSILGIIFFMGYRPEPSDAEILARAKRLGMVDQFMQPIGDIKRNPDGSLMITIHENEKYTEVSQKLYSAGVIDSSIEFEIMMKKENLLESIKPGDYTIRFEDDVKTIIQKITGK